MLQMKHEQITCKCNAFMPDGETVSEKNERIASSTKGKHKIVVELKQKTTANRLKVLLYFRFILFVFNAKDANLFCTIPFLRRRNKIWENGKCSISLSVCIGKSHFK